MPEPQMTQGENNGHCNRHDEPKQVAVGESPNLSRSAIGYDLRAPGSGQVCQHVVLGRTNFSATTYLILLYT
jgi:hypothetical protein